MSEIKEQISQNANIDDKIVDILVNTLGDKADKIDDSSINAINSLDQKNKETLLNLLTKKPEISYEIFDNIPITLEKIQKIIVLNNTTINKENNNKTINKEGQTINKEGQTINKELQTIEKNNNLEKFIEIKDKLVKELDLKNNPNYQKYQNEAKEKLLASNPNLEKDKNFSDYVDGYILIQHQKEFLAGRPDLQSSFDTLNKNASRLEIFKNIRIDEYIDRNLKDGTLKREKEQIKASLLPNGEDLQISGNEFRSGDQVTILDKDSGPKKFIERYGYKVDTSQELETPYKYQYDKEQIISNYNSKRNDYTSKQKTLGQLAQDIKNKEKQINEEGNSLDENASFRKDIFKAELETFLKDFNKLTQDSKQLEQQIKELEQKAQELQTKEDRRIGDYRDSQLERDEKARQTLEFLHNIGFTNISQSDFESIARIVNSSPSKYGFSRNIDLNQFFEIRPGENPQRPYVEFVNFFNKLLGLEGKDQINVGKVSDFVNGNDKGLTGSSFESKVRNTLYSEGNFRFTLIEERFSGKNEK